MSGDDVAALLRQVERAGLFTHSALGRGHLRQRELESFVYGLIDVLLAHGVIEEDELRAAVQAVRDEMDASGEPPEPGVVLRVDESKAAGEPPVEVNCAERMHICHAVCCELDFALSGEEIERGVLRWDMGRPYVIRHEDDGLCVHNDRATGGCQVYDDRPTPCRRYSCATDERIWTDFDAMELNTEWIEANLGNRSPRLLHAMLAARASQ
jgi:Fe-S-cluster containining protein